MDRAAFVPAIPTMSLLRYLENRDGLPRPSGLQSAGIIPRAVSQANKEVRAELVRMEQEKNKKRGSILA